MSHGTVGTSLLLMQTRKTVLALDFWRFCLGVLFFILATTANEWPPTSMDFYPRFNPLHLCPIL